MGDPGTLKNEVPINRRDAITVDSVVRNRSPFETAIKTDPLSRLTGNIPAMSGKGRHRMNRRLTAIVEREGDGYVALCPEVDVASQGDTVTEARDNLAEALTLFFETASAGELDRRLRGEVYVTHVEVAVG